MSSQAPEPELASEQVVSAGPDDTPDPAIAADPVAAADTSGASDPPLKGGQADTAEPADTPEPATNKHDRYMKRAEPVMLVLALASIPLFLMEEVFLEDPHWLISWGGWAIVAAFAADLAMRLWLNPGPTWAYLRRYWFDAAIVVLSILPFLRPLRALRALQVLRGARGLIAAHKAAMMLDRNVRGLRGKGLILSCIALSVAAVFLVYSQERDTDSGIDSLPDALWWAAATVTTVGYGDLSPKSAMARVAAFVLMVCGVSLFGLITANVSAKFLSNDALLAYDQMVELVRGRECPHCGYTPNSRSGTDTDGTQTARHADGDGDASREDDRLRQQRQRDLAVLVCLSGALAAVVRRKGFLTARSRPR